VRVSEKPFHFGVQAYNAPTPDSWVQLVQRVEELGFWSFHVPDHYLGPGPIVESTGHPSQDVAALVAMSIAAQETTTLRIGSRMLCVDYHEPAVLAKEIATLAYFSHGRIELGLGAGWLREEYDAMGIAFRPASERIAKLGETISLLRQHWSGEPISLNGEFVRVRDYVGLPRLDPGVRPRIMVGGGGRKILRIAAERADIVSMNWNNGTGRFGSNSFADTDATSTLERISWIREFAGVRIDELEIEVGVPFLFVTKVSHDSEQRLAHRLGLNVEQVRESPHILIGSANQIVETLLHRRATYGISYVTVLERSLFDGSGFEAMSDVMHLLTATT
jgi:probable F420-dependent oxidoreductase